MAPNGARRILFLLIQTLLIFWMTRILVLRDFVFEIFWIPHFQISRVNDFQIYRNLAWARLELGWGRLGTGLGLVRAEWGVEQRREP